MAKKSNDTSMNKMIKDGEREIARYDEGRKKTILKAKDDLTTIDSMVDVAVDDFEIANLSVAELHNQLSYVPSQMAYWGRQKAMLLRRIKSLKIQYDFWYARQYSPVDREFPRRSEAFKKGQVWSKNKDRVLAYHNKLYRLEEVQDKLDSLLSSLKEKNASLRAISYTIKQELDTIPGGGKSLVND